MESDSLFSEMDLRIQFHIEMKRIKKNTALNAWAHLVLTLDYQACNLIDDDLEMVKNTFHTNIILTGKLHN